MKCSALGIKPSRKLTMRCDFGVLGPDSGGTCIKKRSYWSNRATLTVSDLGIEARLTPGAWGTVTFEP